MVLQKHPSFPATRSYVLKLHRDAPRKWGSWPDGSKSSTPASSSTSASGEELLACLAHALASARLIR